MTDQWFDFLTEQAGALHVHTVKSNGAGTLAEVVSAAERAGLQFLIITDHETRGYADEGAEGWQQSILVLVGEELSLGFSRFIILGHASRLEGDTVEATLRDAQRHNAITVALPPEDCTSQLPTVQPRTEEVSIAPPEKPKPPIRMIDEPPPPLELVDGWEFWCGLEDWARGRADRKPMTDPFLRTEHVGLQGPRRGAMRMWDELTLKGRILGFSGLNAHGRSWTSTRPGAALPYEILFRSLTTHVLAPELPRDSPQRAREILLKALRQGHFHTAHSCIASPRGFRFIAAAEELAPLLEGDEAHYDPRLQLHVRLPRPALIKLIYNGSQLLSAEGEVLDCPVVGPGVYRVEAWLERNPWIFSNPIWLHASGTHCKNVGPLELEPSLLDDEGDTYSDLLDSAT